MKLRIKKGIHNFILPKQMTEQLTVEIDVKSVMDHKDHKETWKTHRKAPLFALLNVLFTIYNLPY